MERNVAALSLRSLARALGGEVTGSQVLAPGPGHSRKDRSLSIRLSSTAPEGFLAFSHAGDDFATCRDYVKQALGITTNGWRQHEPQQRRPTPTAAELDDKAYAAARTRRLITAYIRELGPIRKSPGEGYLAEERKINTDAIADVLKRVDAVGWHPAVHFYEPGHPLDHTRLGCIIGIMTDPVTALPTGAISRTYLHDGKKIGKAKTLGSPTGIIRLSEDADVLFGLHLAEGIETGLSLMAKGFRPLWATGSTSLMRTFPVLDVIEWLTIFADHDPNSAGEEAARATEARWRAVERKVRLRQPNEFGDFNDAVMGEASEAAGTRESGGIRGAGGS
jgi:putative DNA primase/helicase